MPDTTVYICDCLGLVSDHVDTAALEEMARGLDGVDAVHRVPRLCGPEDLARMSAELRASGTQRLLFAGCSPRMSLKLPEEALVAAAQGAGIDPDLVEVANIRELCAWLHTDDPAGASAKARDMVRMAHARLQLGEPSAEPVKIEQRALVIGGGPAGLAATRDLTRAGIGAVTVEAKDYIGGKLCQIPIMFQTEGWPSICESQCTGPVQAAETLFNPLSTLYTGSTVQSLDKVDGNFVARIHVPPMFVDPDKCVVCGKCEAVCPEEAPNSYEMGLATRKAISKPFQRAVPDAQTILEEACTRCGDCLDVCPSGAINLDAKATVVEETVGAVVLATGTDPKPPPELGQGNPDVITAMELERLLATGLRRPSDGEEPEHIVFVQCAGSRAGADKEGDGVPYCSKTCCSVTAKQAKRIGNTFPMTEVSIVYYRDFRTYERSLEKLYQDVRGMGLEFHNGEVTSVERNEDDEIVVELNQLATEDQEDDGATETLECDLVVLACAQVPELPAATASLGMPVDPYGFPIENQPRIFRPTETFVDRVFAIGAAAGPKGIQPAVEQGSAAALKAIHALSSGLKQPPKYVSSIDPERCSECSICADVCPHGAAQTGEDHSTVDPAFCQACGLCAASCPSHAAQLRNFGDAQILAEAGQAFTEVPAGEPKILALLCYWCSYGGADLAGLKRYNAPSSLRTMRVRCSCSVNMGLITELFRMGIDGILIAGCPPNSCHHMWGNWLTDRRTGLMKSMMRQMGLDEGRLKFEYIGIMGDELFVQEVRKMRAAMLELEPHPWGGDDGVTQGGLPTWQTR